MGCAGLDEEGPKKKKKVNPFGTYDHSYHSTTHFDMPHRTNKSRLRSLEGCSFSSDRVTDEKKKGANSVSVSGVGSVFVFSYWLLNLVGWIEYRVTYKCTLEYHDLPLYSLKVTGNL